MRSKWSILHFLKIRPHMMYYEAYNSTQAGITSRNRKNSRWTILRVMLSFNVHVWCIKQQWSPPLKKWHFNWWWSQIILKIYFRKFKFASKFFYMKLMHEFQVKRWRRRFGEKCCSERSAQGLLPAVRLSRLPRVAAYAVSSPLLFQFKDRILVENFIFRFEDTFF